MKGMYNMYETYPCPYYFNASGYNQGNMYDGYRTYPCPYYVNTPMYDSDFEEYFANDYSPFTDELEYDSTFDFSRGMKNDGSIQLKDYGPEPFVVNINEATKQNNNFRTVLWTGENLQVTLMSININDDIGLEIHPEVDQFLRVEEGQGLVRMGDSKDKLDYQQNVQDDFAIMIPAGKWHNIINTGNKPLKLYSIYAPPQHPRDTVHQTKADAQAAE